MPSVSMQFRGGKEGKIKVERGKKAEKRAQVTLFVIIAIVIVAAVVFLVLYKPSIAPAPTVEDPSSYIEKCSKDATSDAINTISMQGGLINPQNYILYDQQKVAYLCYTTEYYKGCVNQQPLLKETVEAQITEKIKPTVQKCVDNVVTEYKGKGYTVTSGALSIETVLQPRKVYINVRDQIVLTKGEAVRYEKFNSILSHPLYAFVMLSNEIVNSEASEGDFDQLTYMLLHNDIDIDKKRTNVSTIYTLQDRKTNKQFVFAVKSWETPGGFFD